MAVRGGRKCLPALSSPHKAHKRQAGRRLWSSLLVRTTTEDWMGARTDVQRGAAEGCVRKQQVWRSGIVLVDHKHTRSGEGRRFGCTGEHGQCYIFSDRSVSLRSVRVSCASRLINGFSESSAACRVESTWMATMPHGTQRPGRYR